MEFAYHVEDGQVKALYAKCPQHNWYYKGQPPLTTGCKECWEVYYFMQAALSAQPQQTIDELESVIHHMMESIQRGEWDFEPTEGLNFTVDKDVSDEDVARELRKDIFEA